MQTQCNTTASEFAPVAGRPVVAEFDGGALTSDAGGLLLGAAVRTLGEITVEKLLDKRCFARSA